MSINWFSKAPKSRITASEYRVTFTDSPKGIRLNVALTRMMIALSAYVNIGLTEDNKLVLASTPNEEAFKLTSGKSSAQVSAATIGDWAIEKGLAKKSVVGVWNDEKQYYEFDLSTVEEDIIEEPEVAEAI